MPFFLQKRTVMTSHVLALCSKVLFDKQALEDRKELERLKQQCARLARDNDATFCKYKYLLVTKNLGFNYQTDELLDTLHRAGGLTTVLERCKVRYAVEEPRFSFSKAPYGPRCVANDVDLLVKIQWGRRRNMAWKTILGQRLSLNSRRCTSSCTRCTNWTRTSQ